MIFGFLSSREFLAWIIGGWILCYASSMIWTKESFAYFMTGLGSNIFIQTLFVLFLISGYLNLIRSSICKFKKSRWKFFAGVLLPLGILLFFTGFFISAATRQFDWILVGTGDFIKPKWSSEQYRVEAIDPGVKERFLDIDTEYAGKGLFKYEPKVTVRDSASALFEIGAFPPAKINDTYYHILNFGLAPGMSISRGDEVQAEGYMALRMLMPGSSDSFEIQPLPYKFIISLEPERIISKGKTEAAEYNIREPNYRVRVYEAETLIAETVSKEGIEFRNHKLTFSGTDFWVQLEVVKDYGYPVILAGILISLIGIPVFLSGFFYSLISQRV
jgi:hypothetical protein